MKNLTSLIFAFLLLSSCGESPDTAWAPIQPETRPGMRWWWLGSAVDSAGLTANMESLHNAGVGAVEITPIYGITGAEHRHINYLSPRWIDMYKHASNEGKRLDILIDMATGTGWPFGGPDVPVEDGASKVIFQKYTVKGGTHFHQKIAADAPDQATIATVSAVMAYSVTGEKIDLTHQTDADGMLHWDVPDGEWTVWTALNGKTLQKVKRAAPGGEGQVINHLSEDALQRYLSRFDKAFAAYGAPYPHSFFNDSYEVHGADWSKNLLETFEKRRGYRLQDYLPELNGEGDAEISARVVCDYRQTIGELLLDEFTVPWTKWAHEHGATVRNQAHGSPGNLIDYYAAVDIPECESFGFSIFDIPGLRVDSVIRNSDTHPGILKFASSAAHITGKPFVSSETFTWLTEHFRTSLSQMKPVMDQMFLSGINHMYYHGTPYSPVDAPWPGWLFYASVNMNAHNTIFRDVRGLNDYITRVQSFLQYGDPDNDFLVYFPLFDIWQELQGQKERYFTFSIHRLMELLPELLTTVNDIRTYGFDTDYISDKYLNETSVHNGKIQTGSAAYKAIIIPSVKYIPVETLAKLVQLAKDGATVIFTDRVPQDVPGLFRFQERRTEQNALLEEIAAPQTFKATETKAFGKGQLLFGNDCAALLRSVAKAEALSAQYGVQLLRRKHAQGHHYFIALLQNKPLDGWVPLAVDARSAALYDPLTGSYGKAKLRRQDGATEIYLQLEAGQSVIVKTFTDADINIPEYGMYRKGTPVSVTGAWSFRFLDGLPSISGEYDMTDTPVSWTDLACDSATVFAGTGRYSVSFSLTDDADEWLLDLGKLCESARVSVNGKDAGIVWALPYTVKIGAYLQKGENQLDIDVTNLPANRIRDYDRKGIQWRIFKEINFVNVRYRNEKYDHWSVMPSGLTSPVQLIPLEAMQ
ncbi:MAG: glycosyl hydrolase family 2 [Bacteroidales bacterium]|jgi:hypothetical protein|nr:glycosyl hydrolase family 2 [Bacteroidales bacterium]